MKRSLLTRLQELLKKKSKKPWASFETSGPSKDGRLEFTMSWNDAFIDVLKRAGYEGETEEEMVQLFYLSTQMIPESLMDDAVNPSATPNLTNEANILRR
jgi:hypothetical protein